MSDVWSRPEKATILDYLPMAGGGMKGLYNRYGDDALPVIEEAMKDFVEGRVVGGRNPSPVPNERAQIPNWLRLPFETAAALYIEKCKDLSPEWSIETLEISPKKAHVKITGKCPLAIEHTDQKLCNAVNYGQPLRLKMLTGKDVNLTIAKSMAAGDEYCEVTFETKE